MDAFDVLGLSPAFDLDPTSLEQRYRDLQRALHPDRFAQASASERRASLSRAVSVNDAYRALRDELKRAELLLVRFGAAASQLERRPADPALLMEIMELREALAEAKANRSAPAREQLAELVRERQRTTTATLREALARLGRGEDGLDSAVGALSELRYYRRFLDEVASLEDALA